MPKLQIHLREGFADDDLEVRVNGKPVAHLQHVSTNWSIGLAGQTEVEVSSGRCTVELVLGENQPARTECSLHSDAYLFVRKEAGRLHFELSTAPPSYL